MRALIFISLLLTCVTADAQLLGRRRPCPPPNVTVAAQPDCFRGRCPTPPQPAPPQNPPKFDFPDDDKPAPPEEEPDTILDAEETSMDFNLVLALIATVLGGVGAYVASRNDDDPDNDMDAFALAKDIVNRIQKAKG